MNTVSVVTRMSFLPICPPRADRPGDLVASNERDGDPRSLRLTHLFADERLEACRSGDRTNERERRDRRGATGEGAPPGSVVG
jgi:hypothetical protein